MDNDNTYQNKFIERKKDDAMKFRNRMRVLTVVLFLSVVSISHAQDTTKQSTDLMRSNGRIYVVIAVMLTILIGLILFLVRLDKKITNLEKEN